MHQGNTTFTTEEIEIHIRKYRSLLKSAGKIKISQLTDSHKNMNPLLHEKARIKKLDTAAFIYVLLRLPKIMSSIKTIVLGQSYDVFKKHGYKNVKFWKEVSAPGRRRKMFYNGKNTLAVYIASVTDVDDIITLLTSFQIEWNKCRKELSRASDLESSLEKHIGREDMDKIKNIWGKECTRFLKAIKKRSVDFTVSLLAGSYVEYAKATQKWWENVLHALPELKITDRPIYFVSSNTHSIVNILTHFALNNKKQLIDYLYQTKDKTLINIWEKIQSGKLPAHKDNFLYYIAKKYEKDHTDFSNRKRDAGKRLGIHTVHSSYYLDIDTQIIEIDKLADIKLNQQINIDTSLLQKSKALIVNIDYPLGWAAYQILTEIGQNISNICGAYIMGKAATLNGQIGDILIPDSVFDQHTKNVYVFDNCISTSDFTSIFKAGLILDHQKTIAVKGTFLQNSDLIKKWYREGYSILEMETGPYLNALYEFVYYNRYVENRFVNLTKTPFEIGIAHYASDTPYSKAKNLGVRNLSFEGVEPTYAISLVILKKILEKEMAKFL